MRRQILPAVLMVVVLTVICGLAYVGALLIFHLLVPRLEPAKMDVAAVR